MKNHYIAIFVFSLMLFAQVYGEPQNNPTLQIQPLPGEQFPGLTQPASIIPVLENVHSLSGENPVSSPLETCLTCPSYDYIITPASAWQTHSSSIVINGCRIYILYVVQGNTYSLKTGCGDGATAAFDTYLELYNNSCSQVTYDDDGCESNRSKITWLATYSGYAYLKVRGYNSSYYGNYTLAYNASFICKPCPEYDFTLTPAASFQTHSSSTVSNGCKVYRFSAVTGYQYTFKTGCGDGASAAFDTYLELSNSGCSVVAFNDDGCSPAQSIITWTADYSGYAYLQVRGYNSSYYGNYTLAYNGIAPVTCLTCPSFDFTITPTTSFQTHSSSIVSDGCRMYKLSVTSGNTYTFKTGCGDGASAAFDTYLELLNGSCTTITYNDDGCAPSQSIITWTADYTGDAWLKVRGYNSSYYGIYTLAYNMTVPVICLTCPGYDFTISPTQVFQTHTSSIVSNGCRIYAINLIAGYEYIFKTGCGDGATAAFDTYLTLYNSSCTVVAEDDDNCENYTSAINYTASFTGTAYLKVNAFGNASGSYTLAYTGIPYCKTCPQYNFSITPSVSYQTHNSSIINNGCKIYSINVVSGNRYIFKTGCGDGATASFDTYLELYNSSCAYLASDDDVCENFRSWITWQADYTGVAYLKVSSATIDDYGEYTLAYRISSVSWKGTVSSDWFTPGNWVSNQVPASITKVIIPPGCPNYPAVNGAKASCYSLLIQAGANLTVGNNELEVADRTWIYGNLSMNDPNAVLRAEYIGWYSGSTDNVTNGSFIVGYFNFLEGTHAALAPGNTSYIHFGVGCYDPDAEFGNLIMLPYYKGSAKLATLYPIRVAGYMKFMSGADYHTSLDIIVAGSLTIENNAKLIVEMDVHVLVNGDFNLAGHLVLNEISTLVTASDFIFPATGHLELIGGTLYSNLNTPTGFTTLSGKVTMNVNSVLGFSHRNIIIGSTFQNVITGGTLRFGGSLEALYPGTFQPGYGTVEFITYNTGSTLNIINGNYLNHVIVNKLVSVITLTNPLIIKGNLDILEGTLHSGNQQITIGGNWNNTVGDAGFNESTGKVIFDGPNSADILNNESFYHVDIGKTWPNFDGLELANGVNMDIFGDLSIYDGTLEMNMSANLYVAGNLYIASGAGLNANDAAHIITIVGNWTNQNTGYNSVAGFTPGAETVYFSGTGNQWLSTASAAEEFTNLKINKTAGEFNPEDPILVINTVEIMEGLWIDYSGGLTHTICGDFTIGQNAEYNPSGTTVFKGVNDQYYVNNGGIGSFYNIVVDKTPLVKEKADPVEGGEPLAQVEVIKNPKTPFFNLNSDMETYAGGYFTVEEGTVTLNQHTLDVSGEVNINAGGILQVDQYSTLFVGTSLNVNNQGILQAMGFGGSNATVSKNEPGYFDFNVYSGGTIWAEHTIFSKMGQNGIHVWDGAIVEPDHSFIYCTFQDGFPNASALLTINNDQDIVVTHAGFPDITPNGSYNVWKGVNAGNISFDEATGAFSGPPYEYDPFYRVHWYVCNTSVWTGIFSTDWFEPMNWCNHTVPDATCWVEIPPWCPHYPVIANNDAECNYLIIDSTASVTIVNSLLTSTYIWNHGTLNMTNPAGKISAHEIAWYSGSKANVTSGEIHVDSWYFMDGTDAKLGTGNIAIISFYLSLLDEDAEFGNLILTGGNNCLISGNYPLKAAGNLTVLNAAAWTTSVDNYIGGNFDVQTGASYTIAGSHTVYLNGSSVFALNGKLDINDGNLFCHHGFELVETGELIINNGIFVMDAPYIPPADAFQMFSGALTMRGGLLEMTHNSFWFGPNSVNNITGGIIRCEISFRARDANIFQPSGGVVEITGSGATGTFIECSNGNYFHNLYIDRTNIIKLQCDIEVKNNIEIISGPLSSNFDNNITVGGSWINIGGESAFDEGTGTVMFTGNSESAIVGDEVFYNLGIYKQGNMVRCWNDLTILHNLLVYSGQFVCNAHDIRVFDDVLLYNGATLSIDENSSLSLADNKSLWAFGGSRLEVIGTIDNEARIRGMSGGHYNLNLESGSTMAAGYGIFENPGVEGVHLKQGAIVDNSYSFNHCTFRNGAAGGSLLTINNDQNFEVRDAVFPDNSWEGAYNVLKSVDAGSVTFIYPTGHFAGGDFDNDPYNRIIWDPPLIWTGLVSNDWHNPLNWNLQFVPGSGNEVTIPANCPFNPRISITPATCKSLNINHGAGLTIVDVALTVTGTVDIFGYLGMNFGNLNANWIKWYNGASRGGTSSGFVTNYWTFYQGCNIRYIGAEIRNGIEIFDDNSDFSFLDLKPNTGSGISEITGTYSLKITQSLRIMEGASWRTNVDNYFPLGNETIYFWIHGTYTLNDGKTILFEPSDINLQHVYIYLNGSLNINNGHLISESFIFRNFSAGYGSGINISGGSIKFYGELELDGNINMSGGLIEVYDPQFKSNSISNISGGIIRCKRLDIYNGAVFQPTGGEIEIKNITPYPFAYINCSADNYLNHLTINHPGEVSLNSDIEIKGNLNIYAGILKSENKTLSIGGNWSNNTGSNGFDEMNGRVIFNGAADQTCSSEIFNILEVDKPAGSLVIRQNTQCAVYDWTSGGIWVDGGTFTANDLADGGLSGNNRLSSGNFNLTQDPMQDFYLSGNLEINDGLMTVSGGTSSFSWGFYNNCHVAINGGILEINTPEGLAVPVNYTGFFTQNITGGLIRVSNEIDIMNPAFTLTGGTIELYGNQNSYIGNIPGTYFNNLIINITNNKGNKAFLFNDLLLLGDLTIDAGTFDLNGNELSVYGNITINMMSGLSVDAGAALLMAGNKTLTVNQGGLLSFEGVAGNTSKMTGISSANYNLNIEDGGMISARYAIFENMGTEGIYVKPGAWVDSLNAFEHCLFRNGKAGGRLLSIENDQIFTVNNAEFPSNTWGGAHNVYKSVNGGYVTFHNSSGAYAGTSFEYDPYYRIDWEDSWLSVVPPVQNVTAPAGTTTFNVSSNTSWTVAESVSWFSVLPMSGSGNSTITVTYNENMSVTPRSGQITLSATGAPDVVVTVNQAGAAVILSVIPSSRNVPASAGSTTFDITSNTSWTVSESVSWFSVLPMSGSGNGTITVTYSENTSVTPRSGQITLSAAGAQDVVVTVNQAEAAPVLSVMPASRNVQASAGSIPFYVTSNTSWSVSESVSWFSVLPMNGSGNGPITVTYSENTSVTPRSGQITVSAAGVPDVVVTVNQAGEQPFIAVTPNTLSVSPSSGTAQYLVSSNTDWTVQENESWFTVNPSGGSGSGVMLTVSYDENGTGSSRTGAITVSDAGGTTSQTVYLSQASWDVQSISLPQGWSGLSGYIMPARTGLSEIFSPVANDLVILQNFTGFYYPAEGVNTIGPWASQSAYSVKMNAATSLHLIGNPESNKTFNLTYGWSLLPVICNVPVNTASLVGSLGSSLIMIKEIAGNKIYWPAYNIYSLSQLNPGSAFYIKTDASGTLVFPDNISDQHYISEKPESEPFTPWNPVHRSVSGHVIGISSQAVSGYQPGDILGVFNQAGICCGVAPIADPMKNIALIAYGDDPFTSQNDGFTAGQPFTFRLYRPVTGEETGLVAVFDPAFSDNNAFVNEGISGILYFTPHTLDVTDPERNSILIFPNPVSREVRIKSNTAIGEISLTGPDGSILYNRKGIETSEFTIDLTGFANGVYNLKIDTNGNILIRKIVKT